LVRKIKEKKPDWLTASFVLEDVAAAAETAEVLGVDAEKIIEGLNNFRGLRGRLDFIQKKPFAVVVDYAHTPDSLRAVYVALRRQVPKVKGHKLICVLGSAGGGRDKWKRPELGRIAGDYCDKVILTGEDPYDENPEEIMKAIEAGIPAAKAKNVSKISDRREALRAAVRNAKRGDLVVSTGMGSQEWFYGPRGAKIPWDERKIIEEILKNKR
ncbi:MAG: hypothetical protein UY32_C0013G0053, partial [Candidatus Jorgensenbacteria bacterium GW2011_GWC1_48_8]